MGKKEKHGFRLPEGYFESFPEKLQERLRQETDMSGNPAQDATSSTSEALRKLKKRGVSGGFRTPEGYFERFGERLSGRMEQEAALARPGGKLRLLSPQYLSWAAAAAAAILLAVVLWPAAQEQKLNFGDLADAEIEQYLEMGYEDVSAYELAESLPIETIDVPELLDAQDQEQQLLEYLDSDPEVLEEVYWEEKE